MSKKKATMSLKDFHGGSIPSNLPLPSAPGMIVRQSGFDRGNPIGRGDYRLRPASAGCVRGFDDRGGGFVSRHHIGRYFDEDERTPLDGLFAPRRTVSERTRPLSNQGLCGGSSFREGVNGNPAVVGDTDVAMKLAHASALEKVSSGRWGSNKVEEAHRVDIQVISHPQIGTCFKGFGVVDPRVYGNVDVLGGREFNQGTLVRQMEKSSIVDDEGNRLSRVVGNFGRPEVEQMLRPELSDRPKLNLLPRSSRPSETVEPPPTNYKQSYEKKPRDPVLHFHVSEAYERVNTDAETGRGVQDRPKLSLKPRMQPLDQLEINTETKRNTLFGGARPREMVLKERGINDVGFNNYDQVHPSNRVKQDVPRGEILPVRYNGKAETAPIDYRTGRIIDKRDHRGNVEKSDMQRKNWRNENRRSNRDLEKIQPPAERAPSPETWRKPIEQPASPTGLRYGKAASAVELAQAFSKSVSDPKAADRLSGQRGLPGRGQIPFSRLTGPQSRPRINGY